MNELCWDLEHCTPWLLRRVRRPGPVRDFRAMRLRGRLFLRWLPPRGARLQGYRIERTREGRDYEPVATVEGEQVFVPLPDKGEPWFYRVTPFNESGDGGFRLVWFVYKGRGVPFQLFPIPVREGRRVDIYV